MVNPAVVEPAGDTPTVSVTSVVLNSKILLAVNYLPSITDPFHMALLWQVS